MKYDTCIQFIFIAVVIPICHLLLLIYKTVKCIPRSWSKIRHHFQIWTVDDISLNIATRALNQPPKWPQFCLDYDSVTFVLPIVLKSDVKREKITYFGSRFWNFPLVKCIESREKQQINIALIGNNQHLYEQMRMNTFLL